MASNDVEFSLNPDLDIDALAAEFKQRRRLQIKNVFPKDVADALLSCLMKDVTWDTAFNEGSKTLMYSQDDVQGLSPQRQQEMAQGVFKRANDQFQYLYHMYPMVDAYKDGRDPGLLLHKLFEFINSEPYIPTMRKITGKDDIIKSNAQATLYKNDCFLTRHDDFMPHEARLVAYVFNMTKGWKPDWGGYLQFYDGDLNITDGFMPTFNTLNIFDVGQDHSVSFIAPFVGAPRFSITGWLQQ